MMENDAELGAQILMVHQRREFLKKAKSRKGQQPTQAMRRSRAQLEQDFLTGDLNDQMRNLMNRYHMKTTFIGEAYPPSTESISTLTSISLHDLRLETHHRGRFLLVRTFCEPTRISSVKNAVEDVQGNVCCLCIYNLPSAKPMDRVLPKGRIFAVKEPYFEITSDDGIAVRVDHPSDLVLLDSNDTLVPPQWRRGPKATWTLSELMDEVNTAFKQGNWQKCDEVSSEALKKTDNTDLRSALHQTRAEVHFNLGQYELASEYAIAAVNARDNPSQESKLLIAKSYLSAGRAEYQLGKFTMAKRYFDQALSFDPTNEDTTAELARTEQRVIEEQTGQFDFDSMARSATKFHRKLDHATFTNNTRIASAGKRGRGLFATKDIKHGDIVMVEKAFCVTFGDDLGDYCSFSMDINTGHYETGATAEFLYDVMDNIRCNPSRASEFVNLYDGGKFKGKKVMHVDGVVVLDAFQIQAISRLNGFHCPNIRSSLDDGERDSRKSTGIWLRASYMNHSCVSNTHHAFIGDMMIVRATCDIKADEEIFTSYEPTWTAFPKRKAKLSQWGFQCECPLCLVERDLPESVFTVREQLEKEAWELIVDNPPIHNDLYQPISATALAEGKEILRRLEETYDQAIYKAFPRLACVEIDLWLIQAALCPCVEGISQTLDIVSATRLMQDLGYKVKVRGSEASIDRTNGMVCPKLVFNAVHSSAAWRRADKPEVARAFIELGREVYLAICGVMDGWEESLGDLERIGDDVERSSL